MSDSLLRRHEVEKRVGLSRASIYRLIGLDQFPRPVRTGLRAVGWSSAEIDAWQASRPRAGGRGAEAVR